MIQIPLHALVVMVGPSGAGKSTFIRNHFKPHEVVSSDDIREWMTGDFQQQHLNQTVFEEFHRRIAFKLSLGERVVADATHLKRRDRMFTAQIGAKFNVPVFYIVVNRSLDKKLKTADWRPERLIRKHDDTFNAQLKDILKGDSMATVIDVRENGEGDAHEVTIVEKIDFSNFGDSLRKAGYTEMCVLGDIHGMARDFTDKVNTARKKGQFILSLGDVVDYGPDSAACIDLMYQLIMYGAGAMVIGNHERKLEKYIKQYREGKVRVEVKGGLVQTVEQLARFSTEKRELIEDRFLWIVNHSRHHYVLDDSAMFVHGSATPRMWANTQSRLSGEEEQRAVFGQTDGFRDDGFPNRIYDWIDEIPADHTVYVGHDVRDTDYPYVANGSLGGQAIFVDTGSGKNGKLSSVTISL